MTFGQKIKKLRTDAKLTQKDLAEKMNVSFQTVSKWESDLNEPDISNIKELAKIFNCSFEYLLGDDEDEAETTEVEEEVQKIEEPEVVTTPVRIRIGECRDCHKVLYEGDIVHHIERKSEYGIKELIILCDSCFQKKGREIDKRTAEVYDSIKKDQISKKRVREDSTVLTWAIVIAILGFIGVLIASIINRETLGIGWTIALPILTAYALLADIYCIFSGSWIGELFLEVASWSIKFPGIIFSFSLDGLKFLIMMKLLFWVLGVLIGIGAFLLALTLSTFFSFICFPFILIYNRNK